MQDITHKLTASRQLAMAVNPSPWKTLRFRILQPLRLADGSPPEGVTPKQWTTLLDRWQTDHSVGLTRGVFYIPGHEIEVERFEAAELLTVAMEYLEPLGEDALRLFMEMDKKP